MEEPEQVQTQTEEEIASEGDINGESQTKKGFRHAAEASTLVFKRSHLYAVLLPLAFAVGLSIGYLMWGRSASTSGERNAAAPSQTQSSQAQGEETVKRYDVSTDDDPSIGPPDAAITIIEFSDYECPYCRRWHQQVFERIREEYPDQVRLVFRDFPLSSIHPNATAAAEAANCAGEQEAFWQFNGALFSGEYELSAEEYLSIAANLDLDVEAFESCVESGRYEDEVQADYQYATNLGVRSTPTFFLNGLPIVGAQPYEVFKEVIDKELAGEIP